MEAPEQTREPLFALEDERAWEDFREEELLEILEDADQESTDRNVMMWRGMDPETLLSFLRGDLGSISIHREKNFPNASSDWRDAIAYTSDKNAYSFNAAIGFTPNHETMRVSRTHLTRMPKDTPHAARSNDERYYILDGEVHPDDVRSFAIRFYGDPKSGEKNPKEPKLYRVNREELLALHRAHEQKAA